MSEDSKRLRTANRRHFTKLANNFEVLLADPSRPQHEINASAQYSCLKAVYNDLLELDKQIMGELTTSKAWEEIDKELEETGRYKAKWALVEAYYTTKIQKTEEKKAATKLKMPIMEIKKFDGDIKNWLPFWGNFKRIHESSMEPEEKFTLLLQAISPGSEARTLVESYPISSENYIKCIEHLKSRFARTDLLTQLYVRELLSLILQKHKVDITTLCDGISAQLRALQSLGITKNHAAFLLPMVESALPEDTLRVWQRLGQHSNKMEEELENLLSFLQKEVENNQRIKMAVNTFSNEDVSNHEKKPAASCLTTTAVKKAQAPKCIWCDKQNHSSTECFKIAKMSLDQRKEHLKEKKACLICMKIGHHAKVCRSFIKCYVCGQRHSPVLCPGVSNKEVDKTTPEKKKHTPAIQNYSSQTHAMTASTTLLQTVTVVVSHNHRMLKVRALFDSGSQRSYVKEDVMKKLGVKSTGTEGLSHSLFGGTSVSFKDYNLYNFTIQNLEDSFKIDITALGQNTICKNVPKANINNKTLAKMSKEHKINLTDAGNDNSDIDLLIGADYSGFLMTNILVQLDSGLTAIKTNLGWTIIGKTNDAIINNNMVTSLFCLQNVNDFWNLELLGIQDPIQVQSKQQKEEEVVMSFEKSIQVNEEGRYEVQLPWKAGHDDLLSNREVATRRLQSVTKKLVESGKFNDYNNILQEWKQSGIIEKVQESNASKKQVHYLPHRAVSKESSLTTKLRPVFDASAKDKNGKSLNSCLDKGINYLDKIPELLIGFRTGSIGISADIAKAFLQVAVHPDDRDYLRFLWWSSEADNDIMEYRHCRVVFGLTSSPFLLSATIQHHLEQIKGEQKQTANKLASSFYVDNLITSVDSEEIAQKFINEAKDIMQQAKFDLRQWVTSTKINETGETVISVLGLLWDTATDELMCNLYTLPDATEIGKINKRKILSLAQRIFDPIGILCAITLIPRLILQEIWNKNIMWDEELPINIEKQFYDWYDNIHLLKNCRIPRRLSSEPLKDCTASLHMFCDASKNGYAACVFLRTEDNRGNVTVRLLSAKSRIPPPKIATIPRLELLAAVIGSRLIEAARKRLSLENIEEYCWSDSGVTLCWIKRQIEWNTFVGNRIKEIRQITDINNWHHIPGNENWADLPSRGCTPHQLLETRWWEGPPWLLLHRDFWPQSSLIVDEKEANKELKKLACINTCCEKGTMHNLTYFSKYTKIVRMTAWMLRFIYNTRNKNNKKKGELSFEECEEAEKKIIRIIQEEEEELIEKQSGKLTRFYDKENILRIKTKLLLTDFPQNVKTPVVLPAHNVIVQRMVEERHQQLLHAGTNIMITDLRKHFWIIGIRKLVKSVINKCIICKRHRAKPTQVTTAPLPIERIQSSGPFEVSGVDLAGPIFLRDGRKSWIVVYTCAVYRAVHLELTSSLSTEAFIRTLRRFIARRGRVSVIISDNGANFIGTRNLLTGIDWDEVQRQSTIMRIRWKLNAPTAAWWGGFFERMIKLIKNLLRRVLGQSSVTYEELETLLCDCEAVINDRPLTYVDGDDTDALEPLRPSCFLHPLLQSQVTDLDLIDTANINKRPRYLQKLREDFRQRFKNEYLTQLVQKGKEKSANVKVGDIVLIESEEKRIKWPLGLVIEIYTGKDGVDRTAKVKTAVGYKVRPFQRLYQLELSSSEVEGVVESDNESKDKESPYRKYSIILNPSSTAQSATNDNRVSSYGRKIKMPNKYTI